MDEHSAPTRAVDALDLQLTLDGGALAVGAEVALLEAQRVGGGRDYDLGLF